MQPAEFATMHRRLQLHPTTLEKYIRKNLIASVPLWRGSSSGARRRATV